MGRKRVYTEADISGIVRETAVAEGYDQAGGTWTKDGEIDATGATPTYVLQNTTDYEMVRVLADNIAPTTINGDIRMTFDARTSGYRYVLQSGITTGDSSLPFGEVTNSGGVRTTEFIFSQIRDFGVMVDGPISLANAGTRTLIQGQCSNATWPISRIRFQDDNGGDIHFKATIEGWIP